MKGNNADLQIAYDINIGASHAFRSPNERWYMDYQKHRVADKEHKINWKTKTLESWHRGETGCGMDKDSKEQRMFEDFGGELFPAVERQTQNRIV